MIAAMTSRALDWLIDRTVVPGYSSIGWRLRGLEGSNPDPDHRLRGRHAVITGTTSGIGEAAATGFARAGARVTTVVRDETRGEAARSRILAATGAPADSVAVELCDISSLDSVRQLCERLGAETIDVLVHNAGLLPPERARSADGHELTFAVHVLGPYLMTRLLTPALERSGEGRVIFVTSGGMFAEKIRLDDIQLERREYKGTAFYAHAKRAQVILARELDERLPAAVSAHAMHPGWVETPGVAESLPAFNRLMGPILRDPNQGADTIIWLAAAEQPLRESGRLWMDRVIRPPHRSSRTEETEADRASVLAQLEQLAGLDR